MIGLPLPFFYRRAPLWNLSRQLIVSVNYVAKTTAQVTLLGCRPFSQVIWCTFQICSLGPRDGTGSAVLTQDTTRPDPGLTDPWPVSTRWPGWPGNVYAPVNIICHVQLLSISDSSQDLNCWQPTCAAWAKHADSDSAPVDRKYIFVAPNPGQKTGSCVLDTDPWPDPTRPKMLTRRPSDPCPGRPGSISARPY